MLNRRLRGLRGWLGRHRIAAMLGVVVLVGAGVWGVKLVRLSHSVEANRTYWAEPRGEPGGLLYVALGDSAAQGIGASRPERGYVGLLAGRMREQTGHPVQVVNLSRSGATIRDLLNTQLPKLGELRPDVVTVAIGGNDVRSYQRARFSADVDELTAALPSGTYIADVPDFMHGRWGDRAAEAGGILAARAGAQQLRVVRLHDTQRDRGASAMLTDFAADWFHPNDRGHRVWADAFWNSMRHPPALSADPTGRLCAARRLVPDAGQARTGTVKGYATGRSAAQAPSGQPPGRGHARGVLHRSCTKNLSVLVESTDVVYGGARCERAVVM